MQIELASTKVNTRKRQANALQIRRGSEAFPILWQPAVVLAPARVKLHAQFQGAETNFTFRKVTAQDTANF